MVAPVKVQSASEGASGSGIGQNIALPAPAAAGNLLVLVFGFRNVLYTANTIPGWTRVGYSHTAPASLDSDSVGVWCKIAAGGEQVIDWTGIKWSSQDPASGVVAEFSGFPAAIAGVDVAGANHSGAVATLPALTPTLPGAPGVLVRADWKKTTLPNPGPMTLAGWSLLGDSGYVGSGNLHRLSVWYLGADLAAIYPALARSTSGVGGDTGVVLTAAAYGLPPVAGVVPRFW